MIFLAFACKETPCDVKEDIAQLEQLRTNLRNDVQTLMDQKSSASSEITAINTELSEKKIYLSGKTPRYILKIKLKQSHTTLDIGKHIKDAANAIEFELPVDKTFYDEVQEGTEIVDKFRSGSFWLEGNIGSWKMTVIGKTMRY